MTRPAGRQRAYATDRREWFDRQSCAWRTGHGPLVATVSAARSHDDFQPSQAGYGMTVMEQVALPDRLRMSGFWITPDADRSTPAPFASNVTCRGTSDAPVALLIPFQKPCRTRGADAG